MPAEPARELTQVSTQLWTRSMSISLSPIRCLNGTGKPHHHGEVSMKKVIASVFISLDGVVENPQDWHFPYFNDEMGAAVGATRVDDAVEGDENARDDLFHVDLSWN